MLQSALCYSHATGIQILCSAMAMRWICVALCELQSLAAGSAQLRHQRFLKWIQDHVRTMQCTIAYGQTRASGKQLGPGD